MKHIINSHLHGRPPLSPFNHQLLMREAAKQLKIEQEKKEAERRKVIFFNNLFVIFTFVIIVIFPLLITIYSIISQRRIREVVQKNDLCTVRLVGRVDTPLSLPYVSLTVKRPSFGRLF